MIASVRPKEARSIPSSVKMKNTRPKGDDAVRDGALQRAPARELEDRPEEMRITDLREYRVQPCENGERKLVAAPGDLVDRARKRAVRRSASSGAPGRRYRKNSKEPREDRRDGATAGAAGGWAPSYIPDEVIGRARERPSLREVAEVPACWRPSPNAELDEPRTMKGKFDQMPLPEMAPLPLGVPVSIRGVHVHKVRYRRDGTREVFVAPSEDRVRGDGRRSERRLGARTGSSHEEFPLREVSEVPADGRPSPIASIGAVEAADEEESPFLLPSESAALVEAVRATTLPDGYSTQDVKLIMDNETMAGVVAGLIIRSRVTVLGIQYCFDHPAVANAIIRKMRDQKVQTKLLLDQAQFEGPSCAAQTVTLRGLFAWGIEMRTYKPSGGGFACLHAKVWIGEDEYTTGSVNATKSGMSTNKEILMHARSAVGAQQLRSWHEELWSAAAPITEERLKKVEEKKKPKRSQSLSRRELRDDED